ncbi:hypothetical protein TRVA0_007S02080 [Trichomonascus vanleenenianus]|uniref:uncharacterized protein n=1 Tax=Trichomonascus vanleenenianus TaxID=2268995 RepID=UPI003ECB3DA4
MSGRPTLAVIGLNGALGSHLLSGVIELFDGCFSFPVHAITRDKSKFTDSDKIKYFEADLNDKASLVEALTGIDVLINASSSFVPQFNLNIAMEEAGVKLYFPTGYGSDTDASEFSSSFAHNRAPIEDARARGIKTVKLKVSFFTEWTLENMYVVNVDSSAQTYTRIDDGSYLISFTSYRDVAYSLLSLAGQQPFESIPDIIKIASDTVTVDQFVAIYEKYSGKKLSVKTTTAQKVLEEARKAMSQEKPGWNEFTKVLTAFIVEDSRPANFSGHTDNSYVNSNLFKWQTVEEVAKQHLNTHK